MVSSVTVPAAVGQRPRCSNAAATRPARLLDDLVSNAVALGPAGGSVTVRVAAIVDAHGGGISATPRAEGGTISGVELEAA